MRMRASDISNQSQEQVQSQSKVEVATLASSVTSSNLDIAGQPTRVLPAILEKGNVKMALVAPSIYWISYN
jgi:hypothetical protein